MTQKIAWITGGSSGIGAATARHLAREGWLVAVTSSTPGKVDILCDQDPKFLKPYAGDITKPKDIEKIITRIEEELGPIDLALLNAGISDLKHVEAFSASDFKKLLNVNVQGIANCLEPVLKLFRARGYGHIALTASVAGYRGLPQSISYSASKAALINMAESLAIELYDTDIKVQVINPGFVKTPMTDKNNFPMPTMISAEAAAEKIVAGLKSNRFEIAFPLAFTCFMKMVGMLPHRLYIWILSKVRQRYLRER